MNGVNILTWLSPLIPTIFGSLIVFILPDKTPLKIRRILYGLSAGFFISMTFWMTMYWKFMSEIRFKEGAYCVPIAICFLIGFLLLPILSSISSFYSKSHRGFRKTTKFIVAVSFCFCAKGVALGILPLQDMFFQKIIWLFFQNVILGAITATPLRLSGFSATKSLRLSSLASCMMPIPFLLLPFWRNNELTLPFTVFFAGGSVCYLVIETLFSKRIWNDYFSVQALLATYLAGFLGMFLWKDSLM